MADELSVDVDTHSFTTLLSNECLPLGLDSYQRGFVWGHDKTVQLVNDLNEFLEASGDMHPYYMGTILLHKDKQGKKRFIIDGQQRITVLCLLYFLLYNRLPNGQELAYSGQSARYIRSAIQTLKTCNLPDAAIFDRVLFTVIVVKDADTAFTFFDTQNNRGVRLQATDLLKAYHLRAIAQKSLCKEEGLRLQQDCAARWERIQCLLPILSSRKDFSAELFSQFLWRARRWKGRDVVPANHDVLLEEFQVNTWDSWSDKKASVNTVPIYACRNNRLATAISLQKDGLILHTNQIALGNDPSRLPIALRQPVHKGLGFFLYADKYARLLYSLVHDKTSVIDIRVHNFRAIYKDLLMKNQQYLREAFMVSTLVYVDQFGYEKLPQFALYLEYILGSIRLDKQQVKRETAANFFRDSKLNLLDVIVQSYHPDQVMGYLRRLHLNYKKPYQKENIDRGKGVQGRYKKAVLTFFHGSENNEFQHLSDKWEWVEEKLKVMVHDN